MRKTLILSLLTLSIHALFCSAVEEFDAVRDTEGKKLQTRSSYHVVAADINGRPAGGGGIIFDGTVGNTNFPVEIDNNSTGFAVYFFRLNSKKRVVQVSTDLNIMFWDTTQVWKLVQSSPGEFFVQTGGVLGSPRDQILGSLFRIEKYEGGYKLMYCSPICSSCKTICRDIGVFEQNGKKHLALSSVPYRVAFIKNF